MNMGPEHGPVRQGVARLISKSLEDVEYVLKIPSFQLKKKQHALIDRLYTSIMSRLALRPLYHRATP